jgi:hypothetical protein
VSDDESFVSSSISSAFFSFFSFFSPLALIRRLFRLFFSGSCIFFLLHRLSPPKNKGNDRGFLILYVYIFFVVVCSFVCFFSSLMYCFLSFQQKFYRIVDSTTTTTATLTISLPWKPQQAYVVNHDDGDDDAVFGGDGGPAAVVGDGRPVVLLLLGLLAGLVVVVVVVVGPDNPVGAGGSAGVGGWSLDDVNRAVGEDETDGENVNLVLVVFSLSAFSARMIIPKPVGVGMLLLVLSDGRSESIDCW